ncbi:MAG: phenylalanine--tRNA ligase subunit beta [Hyphomonadaceae bacterium]
MKFTLSWLKEHLKTEASIEAIVEAMTMAGLEVEDVHDPAASLKAFSVAHILDAQPHPNADRLKVCQVDTKDGRKEIVCGAPNARAGLVTIYAPIGARIPASGIVLEARPVRGVVSNGMLCSGAELGVDADADGILDLQARFAVGTPAASALGLDDPVIDFEVTPNRPDWLGVDGIARDLSAAGVGAFAGGGVKPVPGKFASPIAVASEAPEACPAFAGRLLRGVKNFPSPDWMQKRLRAIGLRPRNALVDITNYLCFDRARPLHVYDADKLSGHVRARMGRAGERFAALDGKTYEVTPEMCVIADDARVLGLGGVIGGADTGCTEQTVNVLIESAYFDPLRIAHAGRATGVNSDARYRFERGVDPDFLVPGLELATRMVLDICDGEASDVMLAGAAPAPPAPIVFDHDRVRKLAGLDVSLARVRAILRALGFTAAPAGQSSKKLVVTPPSWRRDVEGQADLVEEVARIEGYDKLPAPAPIAATGRRPPASVGESRARLARRALAGAGYLEAVTWSFCAAEHAKAFGGGATLALSNPIAADLAAMRPSALPNLLRAAQRNLDYGRPDARLFEIGPVYAGPAEKDQRRAIAAIRQPRPRRHWRAGEAPDLFDMKRDALLALEAMGAPIASLRVSEEASAWWRPGRAGTLKLGDRTVAEFGDFHPRTLAALDVEGPALGFEIWIDALPPPRLRPTRAKPPLEKSEFMPLRRDFAFLVDDALPAADLVRAALNADKALIADVALFDVYRGQGVPEGKKSLALEVVLQPQNKTMTDDEIDAVSQRIVAAAAKAVGASLRT